MKFLGGPNTRTADDRTIILEFYRSEMLNARCIAITEELWEDFIEIFKSAGFKIQEKELLEPFGVIKDYHEARWVIDNVYSVQGLERTEGESSLFAIERLVSKYAEAINK